MSRINKWLKTAGIFFGITSAAFIVFSFFVFSKLRPKMVRFEVLSATEEGLFNWIGVGLLLFLVFCLLSLLRIVRYLKFATNLRFLSLVLVVGGVLSFLFVFSDVALIGDIGKQYLHGLAQPEWSLLYPIMGFQLVVAIGFTFLHLFGFKNEGQANHVVRDGNIFLVVHNVGVICGLLGLVFSSLGFLFPGAWNLSTHTTLTSIVLLSPYVLIVIYWLITRIQEEHRQWYDEKQLQDVGKSAFLTLVISIVCMIGLFAVNYNNLGGVVRMLWLPLYLFLVLFLFSAGNLYFGGKDISNP